MNTANHPGASRSSPGISPQFTLPQLATLHQGYRLRRKQPSPQGPLNMAKFALLQSKAIIDGQISTPLPQALIRPPRAQYLLEVGDLVLQPHASGYHVLPIATPMPRTVCVAPLLVLRIRDQASLYPRYLAWLLQTTSGQRMLMRAKGLGSGWEVAQAGFESVQLHLPDAAMQHDIVQLASDSAQAEEQARRVWQERRQRTETTLLNMARVGKAGSEQLLGQERILH